MNFFQIITVGFVFVIASMVLITVVSAFETRAFCVEQEPAGYDFVQSSGASFMLNDGYCKYETEKGESYHEIIKSITLSKNHGRVVT